MNTPAHMALSLAVLGRRPGGWEWTTILAGALLPDLFLYARHFLRGTSGAFSPVAAYLGDVFNSVPLYGVLLAAGLLAGRPLLALLAGSALIHIALDLPLHNRDAHAHFWPFTDWTFVSPISFWDADHHGILFGTLEGVLFVVCLVVIWRRIGGLWPRLLATGFGGAYAMAFVHFFGHAFASAHWALW